MPNLIKLNHFQKFSFQPSLNLDLDELEKKYLQFQKEFHPDTIINKSDKEQTAAISNSIAANEAYKILKSPIRRAIYLLKINAIDINDDHCHIKADPEDLMTIMEINERLLDGEDKKDVKNFLKKSIRKIMREMQPLFDEKEFEAAAKKLIKVKYLDKILTDLKKK